MRIEPKPVPAWPKLAWVAKLQPGADMITVYHGPCVETNHNWCVEAVWAGNYGQADFDQTDLVFGSGLRCREHGVVIVSAGTTLDRLWYYRSKDSWQVANSLPALLAVTGASLAGGPSNYVRDVDTILQGLTGYKRQLPCEGGELYVLYFHNLVWDGRNLSEVNKPDTAPHFDTFEIYATYLRDTARQLAANMNDRARTNAVTPLVTVSQGYDSSVAAVVAHRAGCQQSTTIHQSASLWRGSDSGKEVARHLGLDCVTHERTAREYPLEETIWAVAGRASVLNWTLFDYPEPLCLFLTGSYGDKMWGRARREYRDPFEGTSLSHGGIGEFRLFRGVFHCPVPFWGMRHIRELKEISLSRAMQPWSVGGDYDRPVARRLVEEAGVPRSAFGQRKKNTSHDAALLWPYTPEAAASFRHFVAARGLPTPGPARVWLRRRTATLAHLAEANLLRPFTAALRRRQEQVTYAAADLLFQWANTMLKKRYEAALQSIERPLR